MLGLLAEQLDVRPPVEELGVGIRHQRERPDARSRGPVAVVRPLVADGLSQVVDGLVDHGISEGVAQRVLGHDRLRRDRDDRSLTPPAPRPGRERHRDPHEVQTIARPVGQLVPGVDPAQLVEVIQVVRVLVEHHGGLEGSRRLFGRGARCRDWPSSALPGSWRSQSTLAFSSCAVAFFADGGPRLVPTCTCVDSVSATADRGIDVALEAVLEPFGHLRLVLGAEFRQPVLPPDVGSLDADGPIGRHDADRARRSSARRRSAGSAHQPSGSSPGSDCLRSTTAQPEAAKDSAASRIVREREDTPASRRAAMKSSRPGR